MASNRTPDIRYNGSGYVDLTAKEAIQNVYKHELAERKQRVITQCNKIALAEGLKIDGYIKLTEIEDDD